MKATLTSKDGDANGQIELPVQFNEPVRKDIIERAVLSLQSRKRNQYGAAEFAGKRAKGILSKRRRNYRGSYGFGISRAPRKILSRSGTRFNWTGAFAPGTVSGRRAHPPKPYKIFAESINKKENKKAIRSAIAATTLKELAIKRGHNVPDKYPLVIGAEAENIKKTGNVIMTLNKLGFENELLRCAEKNVRAGKGKMRNRRYRQKTGILIVTAKKCELENACSNIPGVDVITITNLNAEHLAPGTVPGRLTIWTKTALEKMEKEKLFM